MAGSLGSGSVEYHPDRPILHFAMTSEELAKAELGARLRAAEFQITERKPT